MVDCRSYGTSVSFLSRFVARTKRPYSFTGSGTPYVIEPAEVSLGWLLKSVSGSPGPTFRSVSTH